MVRGCVLRRAIRQLLEEEEEVEDADVEMQVLLYKALYAHTNLVMTVPPSRVSGELVRKQQCAVFGVRRYSRRRPGRFCAVTHMHMTHCARRDARAKLIL